MSRVSRTTGQRAGLTRAVVVAGAARVLAASGIDGLTVRAVATELGVSPNAIYRWVPSKSQLVDAVLDSVLDSVDTTDDGGDPTAQLEALLHSCFDTVDVEADLAGLFLARRTEAGPNARAIRARVHRLVAELGVGEKAAAAAVPVLLVYAFGFVALAHQASGGAHLFDGERLGTPRETFGLGVRWILNGVKAEEGERQ